MLYSYSNISFFNKINSMKSEEIAKIIISEFKEELEEIFANQK